MPVTAVIQCGNRAYAALHSESRLNAEYLQPKICCQTYLGSIKFWIDFVKGFNLQMSDAILMHATIIAAFFEELADRSFNVQQG